MKTYKAIILVLLLFSTAANAQITKGNWMVGGNAKYNNSSFESTSSNGYTISGKGSNIVVFPTIGYFVANNFVTGLSGNFNLSIREQSENVTGYGVGPFARYYFLKPEKTVNVLAQISYFYGTSSDNSKSNDLSLKAGPVLYFNSSVGLEFTVDYTISKLSSQSGDSTIKGLNIGFGFQIHLEK